MSSGIASGILSGMTETPASDKVRENRLRRMADRRGYLLVKSRRRDPLALDYGLYVIVGKTKGNLVGRRGGQAGVSMFADGWGMTLDAVEAELEGLSE